jgi:hypothetical protein
LAGGVAWLSLFLAGKQHRKAAGFSHEVKALVSGSQSPGPLKTLAPMQPDSWQDFYLRDQT